MNIRKLLIPVLILLSVVGISRAARADVDVYSASDLDTVFQHASTNGFEVGILRNYDIPLNLTHMLTLTSGTVWLKSQWYDYDYYKLDDAAHFAIDARNVLDPGNGQHVKPFLVRGGDGFAELILSGISIQNALDQNGQGGAVSVTKGELDLDGVIIQDCTSQGYGGGLYVGQEGSAYISHSLLRNNKIINFVSNICGGGGFTNGGALLADGNSSTFIYNSSIVGNGACRGGGLAVSESGNGQPYVSIENSTVSDNTGAESGGGIWVQANATLTFNFDTIVNNVSATGTVDRTEPAQAGGLELRGFSGQLNMAGTIIHHNIVHRDIQSRTFPDDHVVDCNQSMSTLNLQGVSPNVWVKDNIFGYISNCNLALGWYDSNGIFDTNPAPIMQGRSTQFMPNYGNVPVYLPLATSRAVHGFYESDDPNLHLNGNTYQFYCPPYDELARGRNYYQPWYTGYDNPTECDVGALMYNPPL